MLVIQGDKGFEGRFLFCVEGKLDDLVFVVLLLVV